MVINLNRKKTRIKRTLKLGEASICQNRQEFCNATIILLLAGVFFANPGNNISFALITTTETFRLGLTPLTTMLAGILLGPLWGMLLAFAIDFVSVAIWHGLANLIISFSVITMLRAFVAGLLYHYIFNDFSWQKIAATITLTYLLTTVLLTPLALYYHYGAPLGENILQRLTYQALAVPVYVIITYLLLNYLKETKKLKLTTAKLKKLVNIDALTGLTNRRAFFEFLKTAIQQAREHDFSLSLIYFDLDDFKAINDNFGHQKGDQVLEAIGQLLLAEIRQDDISARIGGEEFAVLLLESEQKRSLKLAERLRTSIMELEIPDISTTISASFGVTCLNDEDNSASFVKRADDELYRAKNSGKNQVCSNL